jgi:aspartate kinase
MAYQILGPIADANIEVDMIVQNQGVDGKTDFTFTVPRNDYNKAMDVLNGQKAHIGSPTSSATPRYPRCPWSA